MSPGWPAGSRRPYAHSWTHVKPAGFCTAKVAGRLQQRFDPGKAIGSGYSPAFAESDPRSRADHRLPRSAQQGSWSSSGSTLFASELPRNCLGVALESPQKRSNGALRNFLSASGRKNKLSETKSNNLTWHEGQVSRTDRQAMLGQRGCTIWLTGLSGSGKSTIAVAAEKALNEIGRLTYILDGDNVRMGLNSNLGFSPEDRTENIRRIGEVSKLFTDAGLIVFSSFISPYRADRDAVRKIMGEGDFIEVWVDASVETCEGRDVKGLYKKARSGEIPEFTGISAPYEEPTQAELVLDTNSQTIEESVTQVVSFLQKNGYLGS